MKYKMLLCLFLTVSLSGAVEFMGFSLSTDGEQVFLAWSTASETQNLGFILERKTDSAAYWSPLDDYIHNDALLGQGTVSSQSDYAYTDSNVTPGQLYYYRIAGVDEANNFEYLDSASIQVVETSVKRLIPEKIELLVKPNPFNPTTLISFSLQNNALQVYLSIYDLSGKPVAELLFSESLPAGKYSINWTAKSVPSGIYLCRLSYFDRSGIPRSHSQKIILLK
jgi:hypothetical protein